jgi:ribosomal protein S18 acetylase RimI-like enzyme
MKESFERTNKFKIDTISPDEWEEYKKIRLDSLATDPQAFGLSFDEMSKRTKQEWQKSIQDTLDSNAKGEIIAARNGSEFIAMAGYYPENINTAYIYGVYVKKDYRGRGAGLEVMDALIKLITENKNFTQIELGVNINQTRAIELYKHFGFEIIKIDKGVKMGDGKLYDEYVMRKLINTVK